MHKPILISMSGGRTSAFMSIFLKNLYPNIKKINVFANTGKEREETYEFIDKLDKEFNLNVVWLEAVVNPIKGKGTIYKVVDYKTADRTGKPFEQVMKKYGLPSRLYKHCTRELKLIPITKYGRDTLGKGFITAVGIRADERHRMTKNKNIIYPLCDIHITKRFILEWWKDQKFDLEIEEHQGNCDFCFLKSLKKRTRLIKEGLNVSWWIHNEMKYASEYQPMFDVRNKVYVEAIEDLANNDIQMSFLDDIGFDCLCKAD